VLPGELAPFRDLLAALGCRESFTTAQYAALLQRLAHEANGRPLDPPRIAQALAVAAALADLLGASGGGATQAGGSGAAAAAAAVVGAREALVLPDARGVLRAASELSYNDAPWLDDSSAGNIAGELVGLLFGLGLDLDCLFSTLVLSRSLARRFRPTVIPTPTLNHLKATSKRHPTPTPPPQSCTPESPPPSPKPWASPPAAACCSPLRRTA